MDLSSLGAIVAKNKLFIASLVGTLLGAAFRKNHTVFELTLSVAGGLATCYYFAPIIINFWGSEHLEIIGFVLGLVGMNIISSIITTGEHISQNIIPIMTRWLKKGNVDIRPERRVRKTNQTGFKRRKNDPEEFDDIFVD